MGDYGQQEDRQPSENYENSELLIIDDPIPGVRRLTMNRPEKRNSLIHPLRGAILKALQDADMDPEVKVSIIRGPPTLRGNPLRNAWPT